MPTGAPKIRELKTESSKKLLLVWSPPAKEEQKGKLVKYLIKWRAVSNESASEVDMSSEEVEDDSNEGKHRLKGSRGWSEVKQNADLETKFLIDNLTPSTVYEVTISACTDEGYGPESEPIRNRTAADG